MELTHLLNQVGLKPYFIADGYLYKYVTIDTALKIIQYSSLQYSNPSDFNDPFELTFDNFIFDVDDNNVLQLLDRTKPHLSKDQKIAFMEETRHNQKLIPQTIASGLDSLKNTIGICCFSSKYDSTLMWSHYAENHSGVCLGFKIGFTEKLFIMNVRYVSEITPMKYWENRFGVFPMWVFTKSKVWDYENEIRAVRIDGKGLTPFDNSCLHEIHFGLRTTLEQRASIEAMLSYTNHQITRYQMFINPKTFDVARKAI